MDTAEILIVDDEPINLTVLRNLLTRHYIVRACKSGSDALSLIASGRRPDLILLDIIMPGLSGYDTLTRLRETEENRDIPVIFISALDNVVDEEKGFHLGAVDYISKPFRPAVVLERIRVHLELKKSRDLLKSRNDQLQSEVCHRVHENLKIHEAALTMVTQLVETRDGETKNHIVRTKSYVDILARRLRTNPKYASLLSDEVVANIVKASTLHDIGKIGIPDSILLKPCGLSGEMIPLSDRIMALVDVFDALTTRRVYKEAWPLSRAVDYILSQRGLYFCPDIVDAFIAELPAFQKTHRELDDAKGNDSDE